MSSKSNTALQFNFADAKRTKKDDWILALADSAIVMVFLWGLLSAVTSMFSLELFVPVLLGVCSVFILILNTLTMRKTNHAILFIIIAIAVALFIALAWNYMTNGFNIFVNQVSDVLGASFGRIFSKYPVTVPPENYSLYLTYFFIPIGIGLSILGHYLVRSANFLLSLLVLASFLIIQFITDIEPNVLSFALLLLALFLLLLRQKISGQNIRLRHTGRISFALLLCAFIVFAALLPATQLPDTDQEKGLLADINKQITTAIQKARYQKQAPSSLPEGNFSNLGDLSLNQVDALSVVMSHPDSIYLRGYVGEAYTGEGWEATQPEQLYQSADVFYWLHEYGFFGQTQLAQAAQLLDEDALRENDGERNYVTVDNIHASSEYIYAPYEIQLAAEELLRPSGLGDARLYSPGMRGQRQYSYYALPNQVKRYPELASMMHMREQAGSDPELDAYNRMESHYNRFLYDTYTNIPEDIEALLGVKLGAYELGGELHYSYQEAKQSILSYLGEAVTYNEKIEPRVDEHDFLLNFLDEMGGGYSVHYATAATLMFRYYGIPARYVEGYLIIPEDVEDLPAYSEIIIEGTRAHAWTEFYQDGIGWVPFEVTPPYMDVMEKPDMFQGYETSSENSDLDSEEDTSTDSSQYEQLADTRGDEEFDEQQIGRERALKIIRAVLVVALIVFLLLLAYRIIKKRRELKQRLESFETEDTAAAIRHVHVYSMELMHTLGIHTDGGSIYTPAPQVDALLGAEHAGLYNHSSKIYQEALFSRHAMNKQQKSDVMQLKNLFLERVKKDIGWLKRLYLRVFRGLY